MDELLGFLVLILYLFAAASSKKKKAKKQQKKKVQQRMPDFERAFSAQHQEKTAAQATSCAAVSIPEEDCSRQRVHFHEAAQQQMHLAGEGEDPCHAGGAPEMADEPFYSDGAETERSAFAQDVLRGVIMSEVLATPGERMARRQNRRRAV